MWRFIEVLAAILLLAGVEDVLAGPVGEKEVVLESDPCEFYHYVCEDDNLMKERIQHQEQTIEEVPVLLEKYFATAEHLTDAEQKFKESTKQCENPAKDDRKDFIRRFNFPDSIGGWPSLEANWTGNKFNLQKAIAELGSYGISVIFQLKFEPDPKTFGSRILIDTVANTHLSSNSSLIEESLLSIIGNTDEVMRDSDTVDDWLRTAYNEENSNPLQTNFKGLKSVLPNINWEKQVEAVFDHQIPEDFPVYIKQFGLLKEVLSQAFQAEPKIMANYILYRFVTDLARLNDHGTYPLFTDVILQMLAKLFYKSLENVNELRDMLHVTVKNLHKAEMLFNNEDEDEVDRKIESYIRATLPTINDTYYDDVYKQFEGSPNDCYSDFMKLKAISTKLENELMWKFGPLRIVQISIPVALYSKLPTVSNNSSASKFNALTRFFLQSFIVAQERVYDTIIFNSFQGRSKQEFPLHNYIDVLASRLLVQSYFDWASINDNLVELETEKFGISSKESLMKEIMLSKCNKDIEESVARKYSFYFRSIKEFQHTFNCSSSGTVLSWNWFKNAIEMF